MTASTLLYALRSVSSTYARKANFWKQADKLQTLIQAAKIQEVEPIWASLFAKVR